MLQKRKRLIMASSLMMAMVLVLTLALTIIPGAFATMEHLGYAVGEITESADEQTVDVAIKATDAIEAYAISADLSVHEDRVGDANFTLTGMTYSDKFATADVTTNEIGDSVGRFIWMAGGADGVAFAENEVILTGTYTVAAGTAAGSYDIELPDLQLQLTGAGGDFSGALTAEVTVSSASKPAQEISFDEPGVEKEWGDANFTIVANHTLGDGAVTYTSTNTDVATVDLNTGEVTIVGVGDTYIIAEAAETETYEGATASYGLTVNKKQIAITAASVSDKTYDGTTMATIVPDSLTFDVGAVLSYEAEANFVDANVGADKNVAVVVTLIDDSTEYYELSNDTYETTATISPFTVNLANVSIPDDEIYYSGSENNPDVIVTVQLIGATDTVLEEGTDYTVTYEEDTVTVGEKDLTVNVMGNYAADTELKKGYTVNPYTISNADIALEYTTVRYNGEAKTPWAKVMIGDFEVDSDEYTVEYVGDNVNPGVVSATVSAKSGMNIEGMAAAEFEIVAKDVLPITGISSQTVTYNGLPVALAGTLAVGDNTDGITVDDLTTKWYVSSGATDIEISQPINAGSYKVVYSYDGPNYVGSLEVPFVIAKAISPEPAEMTAGFKAEIGMILSEIPGTRTTGFAWTNPVDTITAGALNYPATYTYNGDTTNYTTLTLAVPVYGLARVYVTAVVASGEGSLMYPTSALEGETVEFKFEPAVGFEIDKVLLNTFNVTSSVVDNMFTVTAGTTDIDLVVSYHQVYIVFEGDGGSYDVKAGQTATFKIAADFSLFTTGGKVYVDDMLIGEGYYKYAEGSTIITLTNELLALLPSGSHTLSVVFSDGGVARATFTVSNPDKDSEIVVPDTGFFTGDTNAKIAGFTAVIVTVVGLSVVLKKRFAVTKVDFDKK